MIPGIVPAAEVALRRDLASGRFQSGVADGRWQMAALEWPHLIVEVRAADGSLYALLFECTDYPRTPVTARPWDAATAMPLAPDLWPSGSNRIPVVFNPNWKGGTCLYLPCDRLALDGHDEWPTTQAALLWDPARGICKYLNIVSELLNAPEYSGRRAA